MIEIKLDFDEKLTKRQWSKHAYFMGKVFARLNIKPLSVGVSNTRKGYHIRITINPKRDLSSTDLVCIQAILGSDQLREANNLVRVWNGRQDWNKLFVKKVSWSKSKGKTVSRETPNRRYTKILTNELRRLTRDSKITVATRQPVRVKKVGRAIVPHRQYSLRGVWSNLSGEYDH